MRSLIVLILSACNNSTEKSQGEKTNPIADSADAPVQTIPGPEDTGASTNCNLDEMDPYDWNRTISYGLTVSDESLEYLAATGWTYSDTYSQLPPVTGDVKVTPERCDTTDFSEVQLEIGREMGYVPPPGETSWRVDFNEVHSKQKVGLYDNARWWSPLYAGPVAEMFLYKFSTTYLGIPGRRMAWMKLDTNYWPDNFTATYDSFEPYSEDMMSRDYGENGWVSLFEGDISYASCQVGKCDTQRLLGCLDTLSNLSDPGMLVAETGQCYEWKNIAAVYAWEVYFGHWDGCMSPHNCYTQELGDPASPETTKFSYRIAGVDLVNPKWVPVDGVSFTTWNPLFYACWIDQSTGGCREMLAKDIGDLIGMGQEGLMNADLDAVVAQRKLLGLWWEGEDDVWYEEEAKWLSARPSYVETALEHALDPCSDWAMLIGGGGWQGGGGDTGTIPGCGDTAAPVDSGI